MVWYAPEEASIEVGWPAALPTPTFEGNKATYADVLPGVDLELLASEVGYAQRFVVTSRAAARQPALRALPLPGPTEGIAVSSDSSGALEVRPEWLGRIRLASGHDLGRRQGARRRRGGGPDDRNANDSQAGSGNAGLDPKTVFPVSIDPDLGPGLWGLAMVSSGYPEQADRQGGSDGVAKVGICSGWAGCNSAAVHRSYFQWATGTGVGKRILGAEFIAYEIHGARSAQRVPSRPRPRESSPPWSPHGRTSRLSWQAWGRTRWPTGTAPSCPPAYVGWNAINAFPMDSSGVRRADANTTIVLRAPNISTGNYEQAKLAWKKFAKNPSLSVTYNTAPDDARPASATRARPAAGRLADPRSTPPRPADSLAA